MGDLRKVQKTVSMTKEYKREWIKRWRRKKRPECVACGKECEGIAIRNCLGYKKRKVG